MSLKRKPRQQAVLCKFPFSASFLLQGAKAEPTLKNSAGGWHRKRDKSRFILTRAAEFSFLTDKLESEKLPKLAIIIFNRPVVWRSIEIRMITDTTESECSSPF